MFEFRYLASKKKLDVFFGMEIVPTISDYDYSTVFMEPSY